MKKRFFLFPGWIQIILFAFLLIVVALKFSRLFMETDEKAGQQWEARNNRMKYTFTFTESSDDILYREVFRKSDSLLNVFKYRIR